MRIIVTGNGGFIGGYLYNTLKEEGNEVQGYDLKFGDDILDFEHLYEVFEEFQPDEVYHLAAQAFVGPGEANPYLDLDINGKGMINMLRCVTEFNVPMVFTSSGSVYGRTDSFPHAEDALIRPTANYGCSKRLAELYLQKWCIMEEINAKVVRFSSVYGPNRGMHGPVNIFIKLARRGKTLTVFGDGSQTRDLLHIEDAVSGMKHVMRHGKSGEIYNVGCGQETTIKKVAEIICDLLDAGYELTHDFSKFDVARSYYDISKIKSLGWKPEYSPKKGIEHLISIT